MPATAQSSSLAKNRVPGALPGKVRAAVPAFRGPQESLVVCVRGGRKGPRRCCDCELCSYQLVGLSHANGAIRRKVLAKLGELSDLGEFSAPEIALEDTKSRLEAEEAHQRFQDEEFERGWYRSGHLFNCTRHYTERYMREQRARTARHIECLNRQVRQIECVVASCPTPPDVLEAFRENYNEVRAQAVRRFEAWEAGLIGGMVRREDH